MNKEAEYYQYRSILQDLLEQYSFSPLPEDNLGPGQSCSFERGPLRVSWIYDVRDQMLILIARDENNEEKKSRLWKSFTNPDRLAELENILRNWLVTRVGSIQPPPQKKNSSTMPDWLADIVDKET